MGFSSKSTRAGCHGFLQGIFPGQGLNPGLLNRMQILYHWASRVGHILILWICYIAWQKKIKIEDEIKLLISPLGCKEIIVGYLDGSSLTTLKHRNRGRRMCQRKTCEELKWSHPKGRCSGGWPECVGGDIREHGSLHSASPVPNLCLSRTPVCSGV